MHDHASQTGHTDSTPSAAINTDIVAPRVMTRDELRSLDRLAVEEMGVPSILLMENAAMGAARCVARMLDVLEPGPAVVVAGTGNNGGDGLALARQLHILGHDTAVLLVGNEDRLTPDAASNLAALRTSSVAADLIDAPDEEVAYTRVLDRLMSTPPSIVADGLLGTGLNRDVEGPALGAIRAINECRRTGVAACVVALDLPSGLDADTGRPLGRAIRADATMTFAALKTGFFSLEAQEYVGEIELLPIGVPPEITGRFGVAFEHEALSPSRFESSDPTVDLSPRGAGRDAGGRR